MQLTSQGCQVTRGPRASNAESATLAVQLKGSFYGDIDTDTDVEVDVDIDRYFACLQGASKAAQVEFGGSEARMVLTLISLKQRALQQL